MVNWTNVFELTFWGIISIGMWESAKYLIRLITKDKTLKQKERVR